MRPSPTRSPLVGLLLALTLGAGSTARSQEATTPAVRDTESLELERYGFSRKLTDSIEPGPLPARAPDLDPGQIPTPRRTSPLPTTGPLGPPPAPPDAPRLELRDLPGATRVPVGVSPALRTPDDGRATYVGDTTCLRCHADKGEDPEKSHQALSRHSASLPAVRRGCEGCHGPGSKHFGDPRFIVNPARQSPEVASRTCLDCHKMAGRIQAHDWFFSRHASAKLSCTTCHTIHGNERPLLLSAPADSLCLACHRRTAREFEHRSHHPVRKEGARPLRSMTRGKVSCIDCHDPHGSPEAHSMLKEATLEDTCAQCHPGHTGPFVFPHVANREAEGSCMSCHFPHGSPHRGLLRARGRGGCVQCHSDRSVDHFPGQTCSTQSCHRDVHGSNTSPLFFR